MVKNISKIIHFFLSALFILAVACCSGGGGGGANPGGNNTGSENGPGSSSNPEAGLSAEHPRIYLPRNKDRLKAMLDAGHPTAVRFKSAVDSYLGGADIYAFSPWYAALIGQLTDEARYCQFAVDRTDEFVRSEEELINGERTEDGRDFPDVAVDSYLEIGDILTNVLLTYDWCYGTLTAAQRSRWLGYADQSVWNLWHPNEASWGGRDRPWSGWSVDNPYNNYYFSFLQATMMLGMAAKDEIPSADGWFDYFRYTKLRDQLVPAYAANLVGGASREGTGYGTAMFRLFGIYDFWRGSTGEDIATLTGHARASMLHFLHLVVPTRNYLSLIGDQSRDSTAALFDYHRNYLQELALMFRDDPLARRVRWFLQNSSVPQMDQPFMYIYDFLYADDAVTPTSLEGLNTMYYGPGTGQVYMRSSWQTDATWMNFSAGPYTESHAHRDQGSFLIYKNGWLAYDPIYHSLSGIDQEEELHNLVRVTHNGATIRQVERPTSVSTMQAVAQGNGWAHVAADMTPVYDGNAALQKVEREIVYIGPDCFVVFDRVNSTAGSTQQIWQLNSPLQPSLSGAQSVFQRSATSRLQVDRVLPASGVTTGTFDWTSVVDTTLDPSDPHYHSYTGGYRLNEQVAGGNNVFLHVLSLNNAAVSVTPSNAGGRLGVAVQLSDGRTATVRFSPTTVDGTLNISGGTPINTALVPGVQTLTE